MPSAISVSASLPSAISISSALPSALSITKSLPATISLSTGLPSDFSTSTSLPADFSLTADLPSAINMNSISPPSTVDVSTTLPTLSISTSIDSEYNDALGKVKALINVGLATDEASGSGDDATAQSAGYWLADEDEIAGSEGACNYERRQQQMKESEVPGCFDEGKCLVACLPGRPAADGAAGPPSTALKAPGGGARCGEPRARAAIASKRARP